MSIIPISNLGRPGAPFFKADDAFANHLLDLGYIEEPAKPGKRRFRHPVARPKRWVYFDYISLCLQTGNGYELWHQPLPESLFEFWHDNPLSRKPNREAFKKLADSLNTQVSIW